MNYELYVIFDKVAGIYSNPMCEINEACAVRHFEFLCKNSSAQGVEASDCELYKVGSFNPLSGVISAFDKLEFVSKGGVVNE